MIFFMTDGTNVIVFVIVKFVMSWVCLVMFLIIMKKPIAKKREQIFMRSRKMQKLIL